MSEPTEARLQLHVGQLPAAQPKFIAALGQAGIGGNAVTDLMSRQVRLACVECGLQIGGDEWTTLAMAEDAAALGDPRLARLRQGYCGRNGCGSSYYELILPPQAGLDWTPVLAEMSRAEVPAPPATPQPGASPKAWTSPWERRWVRLALGAGIILVLLAVRHVMTGGSIPFIKPAHHYTVDPNSIKDAKDQ